MLKEIRGRVASYLSVPIRCEDGYMTTIMVEETGDEISLFKLEVVSQCPDDCIWITTIGQCVLVAQNVVVDGFDRKGTADRANVQVIVDNVMEGHRQPSWWYGDILTPLKICGFRRILDRILVVSFEDYREVHCVDDVKSEELLNGCGIGCRIVLFNVKMKMGGQVVLVTNQSGIRVLLPIAAAIEDKAEIHQIEKHHRSDLMKAKWECIHCGRLNYASKSICKDCQKFKAEGPVKLEIVRKRRMSEQKWFCNHCEYDKNFQSSETCWKCNAKPNHKQKVGIHGKFEFLK